MDRPIPRQRQRGRWATDRQERDNLGPRDGILYQTASRLPVANQVFLGSWTVDIRQEVRSQKSAPQRRYSVPAVHPGNRAAGTREVIRHIVPGESALAKHLVA